MMIRNTWAVITLFLMISTSATAEVQIRYNYLYDTISAEARQALAGPSCLRSISIKTSDTCSRTHRS